MLLVHFFEIVLKVNAQIPRPEQDLLDERPLNRRERQNHLFLLAVELLHGAVGGEVELLHYLKWDVFGREEVAVFEKRAEKEEGFGVEFVGEKVVRHILKQPHQKIGDLFDPPRQLLLDSSRFDHALRVREFPDHVCRDDRVGGGVAPDLKISGLEAQYLHKDIGP